MMCDMHVRCTISNPVAERLPWLPHRESQMYVEDEQNTSLNQKNRWHQMQSRTVMFFSNIKPYRRDMALTSLLLAKQKLGRHDRITVVASCRSASNSCSLCLFVYHRIEELICARFIQNEGGTRVWPIPLRQAPSSFYNQRSSSHSRCWLCNSGN